MITLLKKFLKKEIIKEFIKPKKIEPKKTKFENVKASLDKKKYASMVFSQMKSKNYSNMSSYIPPLTIKSTTKKKTLLGK